MGTDIPSYQLRIYIAVELEELHRNGKLLEPTLILCLEYFWTRLFMEAQAQQPTRILLTKTQICHPFGEEGIQR
jgi:hypothetical protein